MQVIVDGLLVNYFRQGSGRAVLVLHGWGDSSSSWLDLAGSLKGNFDVIIPDLPGFGKSQSPASVWGLDEYSEFVLKFINKISLGSVYAIVGHSNGGAIAIRAIGKRIIICDKLVLLASAGIRGEYKGRTRVLRYAAKTTKLLMSPLPKNTKAKLRKKAYQTIGSDMLVNEKLQETFKKVITDDVKADAAKIDNPTLLVYGEQDDQTPLRYGEEFHQIIPHSTLEVLTGAGHFLQKDKPLEIKKAIEDFLA